MKKIMTTKEHASLVAEVIDGLNLVCKHDINDKICVLKTAANMLENQMHSALMGNAIAQALHKR
jgi:hypothetical protein